MDAFPLTREEAVAFVEGHLCLPDIQNTIDEDPLSALNSIARSYQLKTPFQNISHIRRKDVGSHPTFEEIKDNVISSRGGCCYNNNVFLCALLKNLGFQATIGVGTVTDNSDHVIVLVRHLSSYDNTTFMLDAGFTLPQFKAVPLDFALKSPVYNAGSLIHRFINDRGTITRVVAMRGNHFLCPDSFDPSDESNSTVYWKSFFSFKPDDVDLDHVQTAQRPMFGSTFLCLLLVSKFHEDAVYSVEDLNHRSQSVLAKARHVVPGGSALEMLRETCSIASAIENLLPTFDPEHIHEAVEKLLQFRQSVGQGAETNQSEQ